MSKSLYDRYIDYLRDKLIKSFPDYLTKSSITEKNIESYYYIPKDDYEYQIRFANNRCLSRNRYLIWTCHGYFNWTNQGSATYFAKDIIDNNPLFTKQYIDSGIYEYQKIKLDDFFKEFELGYGHDGYIYQTHHLKYFSLDDIIKNNKQILPKNYPNVYGIL